MTTAEVVQWENAFSSRFANDWRTEVGQVW
jgi:hypothetical protein